MEPKAPLVFTRARHWSLSWVKCVQTISSHPLSLWSILIVSSHLRLGLPSGLLPSLFPNKILHDFLVSSMRATCPSHLPAQDLVTLIIFGEAYMCIVLQSCYTILFRLKIASLRFCVTTSLLNISRVATHKCRSISQDTPVTCYSTVVLCLFSLHLINYLQRRSVSV